MSKAGVIAAGRNARSRSGIPAGFLILFLVLITMAGSCFAEGGPGIGNSSRRTDPAPPEAAAAGLNEIRGYDALAEPDPEEEYGRTEEAHEMKMTIGETAVQVEWGKNESVDALRILAKDGLTIQMSMYGGFEQVGSIGASLPRNDTQTVTSAGDLVLYSGSQLVVFYGSNSWAYTRLGRITDQSEQDMRDLLGNGDVTITLKAD